MAKIRPDARDLDTNPDPWRDLLTELAKHFETYPRCNRREEEKEVTMGDRKVIAVVGATGAQGGGLVRAVLNDPNGGFTARVLTRDVNGARAKVFARLGAEVVTADIDDPESLKKAFEGAYAAFCVTFFWAHF